MGGIPKNKMFVTAVSSKIEADAKNIQHLKSGDEVVRELSDFGCRGLAEFVVAAEKAFYSKIVKVLCNYSFSFNFLNR